MRAIIVSSLLISMCSVTYAAEYPTVRELENGLSAMLHVQLKPGAQVPSDIPAKNRGWHIFYVRAKSVDHGEYEVRIRLR